MRLHFHSPTVTKRLQRGYNIRQIVTITSQLLTQSSARDIMFTAYAECSAQFFVKILKKVLTFRAICAIIKRVCSIISMRHTRHMKPCQIFLMVKCMDKKKIKYIRIQDEPPKAHKKKKSRAWKNFGSAMTIVGTTLTSMLVDDTPIRAKQRY